MAKRRRIGASVVDRVLVDNLHTCCICRRTNLHVQIHHIDGDSSNNSSSNLAVVCLDCHSRVTGDEGLGRAYSQNEVREYKFRWEKQCAGAAESQASHLEIERSLRVRNRSRPRRLEDLDAFYTNSRLGRIEGEAVGLLIDNLGPFTSKALVERLKENGRLRTARPSKLSEYEPNQIVLETFSATKVIVPSRVLEDTVPGVRELSVWIADPDKATLASKDGSGFDFSGTFLYLVTPLYDDAQLETFYSGCSALQVISNLVTGSPLLTIDQEEPLGRSSFEHPVKKLGSLGGVAVERRRIEALYKPRYMTDEQCFATGGQAYRVHDLLGYPLFMRYAFAPLRGTERPDS